MNQILNVKEIKNTNNNKNNKKEKLASNYEASYREFNGKISEIVKIVRFFAIALIIFGVFNIGTGSYAIFKNQNYLANMPVKPEITITKVGENQVEITVVGRKPINDIYYNWNGNGDNRITGNGRTVITERIPLITGDNTLNVRATDTAGQVQAFSQQLSREANMVIQVENVAPNAKITVEGKNEIQYITYRWNNDQETRIDVNATTFEQEIPLIIGENTLTVVAVDVNEERETVKETLTGYETIDKPTLNLSTDGDSNYVITASDANGLTKIECRVNDGELRTQTINGDKQIEIKVPIDFRSGERSTIDVTVYSLSGQFTNTRGYIEPENKRN